MKNIMSIILGASFFIAGILFASGRLHRYLPAWRNMSDKQKREIRIVPLCKNIGGMIALSGGIFLINGLYPPFRERFFSICAALWMLAALIDILYIDRSRRYKGTKS